MYRGEMSEMTAAAHGQMSEMTAAALCDFVSACTAAVCVIMHVLMWCVLYLIGLAVA